MDNFLRGGLFFDHRSRGGFKLRLPDAPRTPKVAEAEDARGPDIRRLSRRIIVIGPVSHRHCKRCTGARGLSQQRGVMLVESLDYELVCDAVLAVA